MVDGLPVLWIQLAGRLDGGSPHAPQCPSPHRLLLPEGTHVCGCDLGRVLVPNRGYGVAVLAAAPVPGAVWHERVSIRTSGAGDVCRQSPHEAGHDTSAATIWIQKSADSQRSDLRVTHPRLWFSCPPNAQGGGRGAAFPPWLVSLDAVHQLEHARLR